MPTYIFKDTNTHEVYEVFLKVSEYDNFCKENPSLERYHDEAPGIVSGVGGIKNDSGWKEVISKVAENHPRSELAKRTLTRTAKEVKTYNIVKKHIFNSR